MCELISYVQKGSIQQFQKGKTIIFLFSFLFLLLLICVWSASSYFLVYFQSASILNSSNNITWNPDKCAHSSSMQVCLWSL